MFSFPQKLTKIIPVMSVLIVTLFSHFVYPGYDVFIGDHTVYMPGILKALDPALYNSDPLMSFSIDRQMSYTIFDELIVLLVKTMEIDLFGTLFCISIIIRFIFFFSIYKLAMYLTKDQIVGFLLVLFFCMAQTKFGSLNHYILPRSFGIALGLLSFTLYFGQKRFFSSVTLSGCLLFHPISFIPFAAFFYVALLTDLKNKIIDFKYLFFALIPVVSLLMLLFFAGSSGLSGLSIFSQLSTEYYGFFNERCPDVFLLSGAGLKVIYVYLFNYILFGFALYKVASKLEANHFRYMVLILIVTLSLLAVTIVGVDLLKSLFIMRLQTMRTYQFLKIVSATLFVYYTYIQIKTEPSDFIINWMLLGTTASLIILPDLALLLIILTFLVTHLRRWFPVFYNRPYSYWLIVGNVAIILILIFSLSINGNVYSVIKISMIVLSMCIVSITITKFEFDKVIKPALFSVFVGAFVLALVGANKFSVHPKYYNDKKFMEVCKWIQTNTDIDAVFLTEPFTSKGEEVRMTCGRSIFATFKNAAAGGFSERITMEWTQRYSLIKQFMKRVTGYYSDSHSFFYKSSMPVIPIMRKWYPKKMNSTGSKIRKILSSSPETEQFIKNVVQRYKVDYILSETPLLLSYPVTFKNDKYLIYQLR